MAFATRRFVKHIDKYSVTHRLEIQEDGFGGSESSIDTTGQVFQFEHETHASEDQEILNVYENPVQKGSIELSLLIQNATDKTLLDDIFNGDEDDFRLVWKIDGSIFWTGTILNDMLEYPESDYPYMAKLWAKDFSRLEVTDYSLDDTRQTLITTFADLIGNLGYGLDIETHTSWINENTTDGTDFLQQIYHETKALREFGRTGDEADTTITVYEALEMMCRNFGCVVRQEGNVFKIIQYSEYETPTAVNVTVYNSDGTQKTAATSTDLTLDASANDITVTSRSLTRAFKGIRKATNTYEHRTQVSNIQFPDIIDLDGSNTEDSFSQTFISDGAQSIDISGLVRAVVQSGGGPNVNSNIKIRTGTSGGTEYWWNGTSWQTSIFTLEDDLVHQGGNVYSSNVSYSTTDIPADADGQIEITFIIADDPDGFSIAATTEYKYFEFTLNNPIAQENSTSIDYQLTQTGEYSTKFDLPKTWFGDGPLSYSVGALRHGSGDGDVTTDSWQRRGSTAYRNLHENLLKEIVDIQRGNRVRTSGDMLGADYDPERILEYRSKNLAYTGGRFDGEGGDWHPVLFEINVVTGTDTFDDIPKFADEAGGTGSSGGGSGAGLTLSDLDPRYVNIDGDTMTGALDMGDNNISNVARLLATEVEIDGDWQLRTQTPGSVNRLFVDPITADSNVEIFVAPSGTATSAALTLADGANQTNYEGIEIAADEVTNRITSLTEGMGTIRELQLRVDGDEDLSLWRDSTKYIDLVSGGVTISQALTAQGGITSNGTIIADRAIEIKDQSGAATSSLSIFQNDGTTIDNLIRGDGAVSYLARNGSLVVGDTTNPSGQKFVVNGNIYIDKGSASNASIYNFRSGSLFLGSNNTTGIEIDSNQNVFVPNGFLAVNKTSPTEALDVNGNILTSGTLTAQTALTVNTSSLTSGFIADFNGDVLVRDDLEIGGGLIAEEFIIEQFRSVPTFQMSPAHGRVAAVSGTAGDETITLEDPRGNTANPFQVGDIIIIKTLDVDGATLNEIYREVMSISGVDVIVGDASTAGSAITWEADTDDTGTISAGDFVIQTGATSNSGSQATRNHYIRWDVASLTTPAMRIFEDVNDSGVSGNEILRLGGMDSYDGSITGDFGIAFKSTSGDLFGYITEDELKLAGGHTTGEWTGVQSGAGTTKAFFAGADDIAGTNASFFVQADGHIFSDAASDLVWSRTQLAAFSVDAAASSITDEYWQQNVARSSDGISNDEDIKIRTMRKKRFSKDKMTFTGVGRRESTSGGGSAIVSRTVTIKANISSVSGTETASGSTDIAFSSDTEFSFTVDISGIPDNDLMLIEISVFVEVDISNYDSGTYETDGYLREDVVIETAT